MESVTHGELLKRASANDQTAWDALVDRFGKVVWSIARSFGLDEATAKDVSQTVWLKLVENLDRIEDPERLPGWLATTCKREALRVSRLRARTVPTDFEYDIEDEAPSLEAIMVEAEERSEVVAAFHLLGEGCRQLLRLMVIVPALSYAEIAEMTGKPVGSLGPTRARCLEQLGRGIKRIRGRRSGSVGEGGDRE
jgi:RNA polymerase sigma factor (sigma-70 family)